MQNERPISLVIVLLMSQLGICDQGRYKVTAEHNKALYGFSFLNITMTTMEKCMAKCLEDCLCMSFQLCKDNQCELCSSDKIRSPSAFRERRNCTNYVFDQMAYSQQGHKNCFTGINCCLKSNPCQNGGTCKPPSSRNTTTHFRCDCPDGYTGNRCKILIKSCRGYINGSRVNKTYKVLDDKNTSFQVFCDFDLNSTIAWTLIQSYQLQHKSDHQKSFSKNSPVNEDSFNWTSYRLSKSRMESIQRDSRKWRMTCWYDTDGVVYTDYVCAAIEKLNILTYDNDSCREVEYIDIRGHNCSTCTAHVVQEISKRYPLHFDSYHNTENCQFNAQSRAELCGNKGGEDNFGFYSCQNEAHRCSASNTSTSQTWFGGN